MATHRRMEERVPIERTSPLGAGTAASVPAFRIGVTGHRPPGLEAADLPLLRRQIRICLELIRRELTQSAASPAGLIIVSPLAEGSDRIVAEEGLLLGYALHALLPFPREQYLQDFPTAESRRAFERLLAAATGVVELAGRRRQAPVETDAYVAVGRRLVAESDLLLAVWNGQEASGAGGTGQVVLDAVHQHLLTIWIRARPPHAASLLDEDPRIGVRTYPLSDLPSRLRSYRPPDPADER
jgi:hypothetical protein